MAYERAIAGAGVLAVVCVLLVVQSQPSPPSLEKLFEPSFQTANDVQNDLEAMGTDPEDTFTESSTLKTKKTRTLKTDKGAKVLSKLAPAAGVKQPQLAEAGSTKSTQQLVGGSTTGAPTAHKCSGTYREITGDEPNWGAVISGGSIANVASSAKCASLCDANQRCLSYEFYPTRNKCNLNKVTIPSVNQQHEDAIYCIKKQDCASGYTIVIGDEPNWGNVMAGGSKKDTSSSGACGSMCDAQDKCLSYEWYPTRQVCNLNIVAQPSDPNQHEDSVYCIKKTTAPTAHPTFKPSRPPTHVPTFKPSLPPTHPPTDPPSPAPTKPPTDVPTPQTPTKSPSRAPTEPPTKSPSPTPSEPPTPSPTGPPSAPPTLAPTPTPTVTPTRGPTPATSGPTMFIGNWTYHKPKTNMKLWPKLGFSVKLTPSPKGGSETAPPSKGTCDGPRQSPINIDKATATHGNYLALKFDWKNMSEAYMINEGRLMYLVGTKRGGGFDDATTTFEKVTYKLDYILFHVPAEHSVNTQTAAMEVQFVHKPNKHGKTGKTGPLIVSTLFKESSMWASGRIGNPILTKDLGWKDLPKKGVAKKVPGVCCQKCEAKFPKLTGEVVGCGHFQPMDLLPKDATKSHYYQYMGSLSYPPCTEDVLWVVLENNNWISPLQIKEFPLQNNARVAFTLPPDKKEESRRQSIQDLQKEIKEKVMRDSMGHFNHAGAGDAHAHLEDCGLWGGNCGIHEFYVADSSAVHKG